jgi:glycosyltransferase involved in cell wall biosynthesis
VPAPLRTGTVEGAQSALAANHLVGNSALNRQLDTQRSGRQDEENDFTLSTERIAGGQQQSGEGGRLRVLVVSDESGLGLGGVPVFNMEIVKGLAASYDVTMLTVEQKKSYDPAKKAAQHGDAKLVNVPRSKRTEGRDALVKLVRRPAERHGLPAEPDAFDVIIGHSRFSGPGAQAIREAWYPKARLVNFLHTSPVRLDTIKGQPEKGGKKAAIERTVMREADLVAGVGPLLAAEAERLSRQILRAPAVHELVPGTEEAEPVEPSLWNKTKYAAHLPRKLKLLLPGRAADEIKGVEAAIKAVGLLRKPKSEGGRYELDVRLTVRGAPSAPRPAESDSEGSDSDSSVRSWETQPPSETESEKAKRLEEAKAKRAKDRAAARAEQQAQYDKWNRLVEQYGAGGVTLEPFTKNPEDLKADREKTHALIMPSLHEGFGLVATEATSQGIPILVNGESGAAEFLKRFKDLAAPMIVDKPFNVDKESGKEVEGGADARAEAWAAAIARLHQELPDRRKKADRLRRILSEYTWEHAAQGLMVAVQATAMSEPEGPAQMRHGFGAITEQGPAGTVKKAAGRGPWSATEHWDGTTPQASAKLLAHEPERGKRLEDGLGLEVAPTKEAVAAMFADLRKALGLS